MSIKNRIVKIEVIKLNQLKSYLVFCAACSLIFICSVKLFFCGFCASSCLTLALQRPLWAAQRQTGSGVLVTQVVSGVLPLSLQEAATLDVLLFVCGSKQLDGLFVDQSPEVLEGDVLTALNAHLLQNLGQTVLILHSLQTGNRKWAGLKETVRSCSINFSSDNQRTHYQRQKCVVIGGWVVMSWPLPWRVKAADWRSWSGTGWCSWSVRHQQLYETLWPTCWGPALNLSTETAAEHRPSFWSVISNQ